MAIEQLNKTFIQEQVLEASEMNEITQKIDELVQGVNKNESSIPDVSGFLTPTQADGKYATLEQIGNIDAILDSINGEVI